MATTTTTLSNTAVSTEASLPKNYAGFNTATIEGRILHAELVTYNGDTWLNVSVIQNLQDDDAGCVFEFNNRNGLMALFQKGYLPAGRRVHLTGHMKEISSVYTEEKTGEVKRRKRPLVKMDQAQVTLGALASKKNA